MDFLPLLQKQADFYSQKPAVIFKESVISFAALQQSAFTSAGALQSLGVSKSDTVAIFLPNIPDYIFSFLAVFLSRAISVPLDYMLTEGEVINFINHSQSTYLIAQEKKGINFTRIKAGCPSLKRIILVGLKEVPDREYVSWEKLREKKNYFREVAADEKEPAVIFYTSGSTGHPKGVLLTYAHLQNPIRTFDYFLHPTDKDVLVCPGIPFSHIGGLDYMLLMLYFGVTLVLTERFQPLEFLRNIQKYKGTIFCIVPSMFVALLSLKEFDVFNLDSLKYAVVFGAPSSPALLKRFHSSCPNAYLLNGWGMTETSAPNSYLPTGTQTQEIPHTGTFPPGTEARIVDDAGNILESGQEGELWIRGKNVVMEGYYREPELTNQVLSKEGWLKTGDIARRDKKGRYSIVGRKKEMIKVSGEIVFSSEVEEAIHQYPKVKEVAVIGVADSLRGEVPKAYIVVKEGESLDEKELKSFLRQHLAHFKIPHHFCFFPTLPKNRVGKIDKERLRQEIYSLRS